MLNLDNHLIRYSFYNNKFPVTLALNIYVWVIFKPKWNLWL